MAPSGKGIRSTWTRCLLIFVFSSYGFVKMMNHDMVLVGVEDIMSKTDYSTGWVSAMMNIPYIVTTITLRLRFVHRRFQDPHRLWFAFLAVLLGSLGVGFFKGAPLRIASVFMTGIGIVSLQTAVMSLTAKYPDIIIHTYVLADACGRLFTPFIYAVLTTYICINPRLVFICTAIPTVIFPLYYHLILKNLTDYDPEVQPRQEREELYFGADDDDEEGEEEKGQTRDHDPVIIPCSTKMSLLYKAFPRYYADYLGLGFQTLFAQCFFTTLVFSNSPFKPREHYQYYMLALFGGSFVGRMYGFIRKRSKTESDSPSSATTEACILVFLGLCNFAVLFIAIWYRNMPNVWVVLALAFSTGFIGGLSYVVSLTPVSEVENHIIFTRTVTVVIQGVACEGAALTAIVLEPMIRQRCFELTQAREYCIARYIGIGRRPCFNQ